MFVGFIVGVQLMWQVSASDVTMTPGGPVTLPCRAPVGAAVTVLEWKKVELQSDDYIFFYRNRRSYDIHQHPGFKGRVELKDESSVKDGDVSVVLKNVSRDDQGTYTCRVLLTNTGQGDREYIETVNLVPEPDSGNEELQGRVESVTGKETINTEPVLIGGGVFVVVVVVGFVLFVVFKRKNKRRELLRQNQRV